MIKFTYRSFIRAVKSVLAIDESRIKKKLIIYFLLISVVSISISMEVILELSETHIRKKIATSFIKELQHHTKIPENINMETIDLKKALSPLDDLRIRMILIFLVIIGTIITSFFLFAKDIANPIDSLIVGAKKVADGDLTYAIPVFNEDEIGQLGKLINDMNANLQEIVVEIRFEMTRMVKNVNHMETQLDPLLLKDYITEAREQKKIKASDIYKLQTASLEIKKGLTAIKDDLSALSMLIDMYKVYQVNTMNQEQEV